MADVAPELLEKMQKSFQRSMENDTKAASLMKKIESGKAKYSDAGKYADEVGDALTKAFRDTLSSSTLPDGKMYWNIAERTIQPMYEESYRLTSEAVKEVQQGLNAAAGIGLKAQTADLDTDIIQKIMDCVCDANQYDDAADTLYKSAQAWNRTIVDQSLKKNAEFQAKSGRSPRIIRTAEANCCSWCADLEGVYEYKGSYSVPEDVYKRHENCKCSVEYDPGTGSRTQNVWSKQWHDDQDRDKIEERKNFTGLNTKVDKETLKTAHLGASRSDDAVAGTPYIIGNIDTEKIDDAISYFNEQIRYNSEETAIIIDKYGTVWQSNGNADTVVINGNGINLNNAVITHNHPASNDILSFGEDDFNFLKDNPKVKKLVAVNEKYTYTVSNIKGLEDLSYNTFYLEALTRAYETGEEVQHEVFEILSENGYLDYVRN